MPLAPGSGDEDWVAAVAALAGWADGRRRTPPGGGSRRGRRGRRSGEPAERDRPRLPRRRDARLGALGLPTVAVQEGGYDLERIGPLVAEALAGIEEGAHG